MDQLKNAMSEVNDLNRTHGVVQRGGKKYTEVFVRVEAFRKAFGVDLGINTSIEVDDGQRVVIKAVVTKDGATIGSGFAEEIRGSSNVNRTSALENAETSAIGRALASLGLHGGAYASLNELDAVQRKTQALSDAAPAQPQTQQQPAQPKQPDTQGGSDRDKAIAWCRQKWAEIGAINTIDALNAWDDKNSSGLDRLNEEYPDLYEKLYTAFNKRKATL